MFEAFAEWVVGSTDRLLLWRCSRHALGPPDGESVFEWAACARDEHPPFSRYFPDGESVFEWAACGTESEEPAVDCPECRGLVVRVVHPDDDTLR